MITLNGIRLWDVKWNATTAGPSPCSNERTEIFFLGCRKAMEGNPCKGCFNTATHDGSIAERTYDPVMMARHIAMYAPNKYITIGGGEPTDQMEHLIELCKELKNIGFHIMVYTWRDLVRELSGIDSSHSDYQMGEEFKELIKHIDILVDGEYVEDERMYNDSKENDGTFNSIGSGNQIVWDAKEYNENRKKSLKGIALRDIVHLHLQEGDALGYVLQNSNYAKREVNL